MARLYDSEFDLAPFGLAPPPLRPQRFFSISSDADTEKALEEEALENVPLPNTLSSELKTQVADPATPAESKPHLDASEEAVQSAIAALLSPDHTAPPDLDLDPGLIPPEEGGFLQVLGNKNFLKLWAGQVFSQLADKIYLVLMIALITARFQTADQTVSGWVSSVMVAFTIPAVLFGSVAGVFVDRWPKKQVLVLTNLVRGALVLVLPVLLWTLEGWGAIAEIPLGFWGLLGITLFVSTLTQFFAPAEQAVIPLIVERSQLLSANSLYTLTMMVAVIVGFAAGEPLLRLADTLVGQFGHSFNWGKELLVGGCYAIAGCLLLLLKTNENTAALNPEPPHVWQDIRDGLHYLKLQRQVRSALIQLVILFSVFAALAVLVVRMAEVIPEIESSQFGFLLAAGGVGMILGVVLLGRIRQRFSHRQLSLFGSIGMAVSLGGMSLFTVRLWPVLLLLACLGGFASLVGIPMQTTIQEKTPEEIRGKIFGLQNNAVNIALSLPLALAGVAETFFGLQPVLLFLAVVVIVGGLLTWSISDANQQPSAVDE
jgi:MFS family permease